MNLSKGLKFTTTKEVNVGVMLGNCKQWYCHKMYININDKQIVHSIIVISDQYYTQYSNVQQVNLLHVSYCSDFLKYRVMPWCKEIGSG